ncbi:AraC-like DNA-binding protein [Paenibacillus rhizosphaerae]|uniref:AraC-like DNA-binding protein n=1 Tax=Paenibacillus rhizosphaerae TaxID=297318 RepID=A0A839TNC8_9BACL|nr:helix-turn-helix domain-containing protein [Paenibacillus rhizosphaerae]MBB3126859.1 AraC-like DNA-binding protein [Paenibacillus rhizosphaerae]
MMKLSNWAKTLLSTTQARLVFVLTIAVFVIILAVSLTSYYTSKSVLQSELSEMHHQLLSDKMNFIEGYIQDTDSSAIKLALNNGVYWYLTEEAQASQRDMKQLTDYLKSIVVNLPYLESVYIFNIDTRSFIAYPQGYSSRFSTFPDSDWVGVEKELKEQPMLVKSRQLSASSDHEGRSQLTYFRKIVIQGQTRGLIAMNFNSSVLFSQMHLNSVSPISNSQYILDKDGNLVYALGSNLIGEQAIHQTIGRLGDKLYGDFNHEGRRLLLTYNPSPITQWNYVSIVPQDQVLAKSKTIRTVVLLVSFVTLVLGAWLIFHIHYVSFRPIRRMRKLLADYERNEDGADFGKLESITSRLLTSHEELSRQIRLTKSEAASKFVQDVAMGNLSGKREIESRWRQYFQEWTDAPLRVIVISIDRYTAWAENVSDNDRFLYKYAMLNIVEELLASDYRCVNLDLGRDKLALLVQHASGRDGQEPDLLHRLSEATRMAQGMLRTDISIGASLPFDDILKLRLAFYEAQSAVSYRLYLGYRTVIPYREIEMSGHSAEPIQDAAQTANLLEAVQTGSTEQALRMLGRLGEHLGNQEPSPSEALAFLAAIRKGLLKLDGMKSGSGWDEAEVALELETLDLHDILRLLEREACRLSDHFRSLSGSKEFMMVQQMVDFMNRHLDGNIGVQEIAASVPISVSLASQLFKQEMGETIHDYLTRLRVERAGELLIETDYKLSEIARMVGYQHENSFIRVFRKLKDITPGKYREHKKYNKFPV